MALSRRQSFAYLERSIVLAVAAIASICIPAIPTAITFLLVVGVTSGLSYLQQRRSGAVWHRLSRLLTGVKTPPAASINASRNLQLHRLFRQSNVLAAGLELVLLITAGLASFSTVTTLQYSTALAAAVVPSSLLISLFLVTNYGLSVGSSARIKRLLHYVIIGNATQVALLVIGIVGFIAFHVPAAQTAIEVLLASCGLQVISSLALGWDEAPEHSHRLSHTAVEGTIFSLLGAALVYANYLLFFTRHHISPVHLGTVSFLYAQASSLALLSLLGCQFINLLAVRATTHEQFFSPHLFSNRKLYTWFGLSLVGFAVISYAPGLKRFFGTGPLTVADWSSALLTSLLYFGCRLAQRHTRKHTRHAVLQLHQQLHSSK